MTFSPCPKPEPREKAARKPLKRSGPIRRRRARHSTDAWAEMRVRVYNEQGEACAGCRRWLPLEGDTLSRMHLAHLVALGMGRSRHDASNPLNGRDNLAGLCARCHMAHEATAGKERFLLNQRLRVASLPRDGHGARRTGA